MFTFSISGSSSCFSFPFHYRRFRRTRSTVLPSSASSPVYPLSSYLRGSVFAGQPCLWCQCPTSVRCSPCARPESTRKALTWEYSQFSHRRSCANPSPFDRISTPSSLLPLPASTVLPVAFSIPRLFHFQKRRYHSFHQTAFPRNYLFLSFLQISFSMGASYKYTLKKLTNSVQLESVVVLVKFISK